MDEVFEIAYAAATNRLCLFTGTGFSRAITSDAAPSWTELLRDLCGDSRNGLKLRRALFPARKKQVLSNDEAAEVISVELKASNINIYEAIAERIRKLRVQNRADPKLRMFRDKELKLKVVTTNYDKLFEELVGEDRCNSVAPGLPIPRREVQFEVVHIHGSIDMPEKMVVTSDDYLKFINRESYFSRKLSTILHENTVVFLGYSLGDTNLKAILNDYKDFVQGHLINSNLFFVSRSEVDSMVKDFYSQCFGIRVLDGIDPLALLGNVGLKLGEARKRADRTTHQVKELLDGELPLNREYVRISYSFYDLISSVTQIGKSINDKKVVNLLVNAIEAKIKLTREDNAWSQYEDLANWLVYLGSVLDLKGTSIERLYLEAVEHSLKYVSETPTLGIPWRAFGIWQSGWHRLKRSNRELIRKRVLNGSNLEEARKIVKGVSL